MNADALDHLLDRLEELIPAPPPCSSIELERHDWQPIWDLAKEIQAAFKSGVQYPSRHDREAAWARFTKLREQAGRVGNAAKHASADRSGRHRDDILYLCKHLDYSPIADTQFSFDPTTGEEMRRLQQRLDEAMRALSERKHEMIHEHTQECLDRIQEVKASHDLFWGQYEKAHEIRHTAGEEKRADFIARVTTNIQRNRETLGKAHDALARTRQRIERLQEKLSEPSSAKWQAIHQSWLEEAETKAASITASISRLESWIAEDEGRLR